MEDKKEIKNDKYYVDDITMMMAWQQHCWMDYVQKLHHQTVQYVQHVSMMNQFSQHQYATYANNAVSSNPTSTTSPVSQNPTVNQQPQQQANRVLKLASIKTRVLAEVIDFLLLACIKVFVIQLLYGDSYIEHFNFVLMIDDKTNISDFEWMLGQAILFRLVVVAYEGYMLSGTVPFSNSATIGKKLLGIKVVYAENIQEQSVLEMTVSTNPNPLGIARSCLRSLLKNASISFFFPMLLPILVFNHNKLLYDCAVGSIVVEAEEL